MRIRGKSVRGGRTGGRAKRKDKGGKDEEGAGGGKRKRGGVRRGKQAAGGCGLPVSDSAPDNAFIMGKGEQRKGLIHRLVRES